MRNFFLFLFILLLTAECARESAPAGKDVDNTIDQVSEVLYSRTVRIKVTQELAEGLAVLDSYGAVRTFPYSGRFEERTRHAGLHLWYDILVDEEVPLTKATKGYSSIGRDPGGGKCPKNKKNGFAV